MNMKNKILFTALLVVLFAGCKKEEPEAEPVAKFSYSVNDKTVTFTNQSLNAKSFYWTFGDGSATSEMSPVKKYSSAGTYTVTLKATNIYRSSSYAVEIKVGEDAKPNNPIADFSYEVIATDARRVKFTNKSSSDLYNFSWDFGDGDTSEEKNPEKLYWRNGSYVVKLTAWGTNSQQKYVCEKSINIKSSEPSLMSKIYIKGFKLYSIPSDGRYYKFSATGTCSYNTDINFSINTGYTEKLYSSDMPKTFLLNEPKYINILLNMIDYDALTVFVYQSTSTTSSGTQCLKQIFYKVEDFESPDYRDEYIVASDNGQTRIGVLMSWSDD